MMVLTEIDGATFDNDAKACFDRIIPAPTSLCSRQLGMPRSVCHLYPDLLSNASDVLKMGPVGFKCAVESLLRGLPQVVNRCLYRHGGTKMGR
jgi:hypothetical protein